jgi:phosphatidylglycerophosphate synthase
MLLPYGGAVILPFYAGIAVAVILARELIVSGFRIIAASKGKVLAADKLGKIKTFLQDVAIVILLVAANVDPGLYSVLNIAGLIMLGIATLLTIISGTECMVKNREILK